MRSNWLYAKKRASENPTPAQRSGIGCLTRSYRVNGLFTSVLLLEDRRRCRRGCLPHGLPDGAGWPHRAVAQEPHAAIAQDGVAAASMEGERFVVGAAVILRPTAIAAWAPFTPAADGAAILAIGTPPIGKAFWLIHGPA